MSYLKNRTEWNLYYSDTDSFVIDRPLSSDLVNKELGSMKLEHTISKAVFLAPKVYSFITTDGETITKIKGVSQDIVKNLTFEDMESLLIADSSLELTQDKWFSKINSGTINVKEVAYRHY